MKIILFGDSITAGYKDGCVSKALTQRIAQQFPEDEIINAGIPGNTSADGRKRLERNVLKYQPDLVLIFFGANDVSSSHLVPEAAYAENLEWMLTQIGHEKVILVTPPFVNEVLQTSRSMADIARYGQRVRTISAANQVPLIDVQKAMLASATPKKYLQEDGLHFSEIGYDLLAALYVEAIKKKKEQC